MLNKHFFLFKVHKINQDYDIIISDLLTNERGESILNFIICDDNKHIVEDIVHIINKVMIPIETEYKTNSFYLYDKNFNKIISDHNTKKIYILDIEVDNVSGLDIAKKIREKDWDSIIIILTAHYELAQEAFKKRLMLLDFISKFDDYKINLEEVIQLGLNALGSKAQLVFTSSKKLNRIDQNDILYITKAPNGRDTLIKVSNEEYQTAISLAKIEKSLNSNFIKTHRACIVNKANVSNVDFKNNIIVFKTGQSINLISDKYKKEVKKSVFN